MTLEADTNSEKILISFAHSEVFSVSRSGVLAYQGRSSRVSQLVWRGRTGAVTGSIGPPGEYLDLKLSPDGKQLALERLDSSTNSAHIWVLDPPWTPCRS